MKKFWMLILGIIILIAGILRFYQLTTIPPSLEWDEVATGYDAYSILTTGKDQYGKFLPLTFRSLDDYKPPLYTYLTTASIALWGWNDFAVRFPAAFLGTLSILTTYLMVYEIFKSKKIALLSALLLAVSPWHINFSRLALETNSTIFFTTVGIWAFFKGLKKGIWLSISALFLCLNLYLYHNARIFIPLFGIILLIFYLKQLWLQKKYFVMAGIIVLVFGIRLIPIMTSVEGQMRFEGTSIFSQAIPEDIYKAKNEYQQWQVEDSQKNLSLFGKTFHNQYILFGLRIFKNYLSHFDPNFYLFTNDYPRHHVPELGIVYFVELPLILLGVYFLLKNYSNKIRWLIILWILLAPVASSVTRDVPHALRIEIILPTIQILASLGIYWLYTTRIKWRKFLIFTISILYFFNIIFFLHQFLYHYAKDTSASWQYGRKEAVVYAEANKSKFDKIMVSTLLEQPQIFFLYYAKYDPKKYLAEGGTVSGGWGEYRNKFDKYEFHRFDYNQDRDGKTMFIGTPADFPKDNTHILQKIYYLNGSEAIWIAS